jgi:pimeloyl-ACP methyl ester carboxylesterase
VSDTDSLAYIHFDNPTSDTLIVWCHGIIGSVHSCGYTGFLKYLQTFGYDIVALDYRGYGQSTGEPKVQHLRADVGVVLQWCKQKGYPENHTVVMGYSMGGIPAVQLACEANQYRIILDSPAFDPAEIYPIFRKKLKGIQRIIVRADIEDGFTFNTVQQFKSVQRPTLFVHGAMDGVCPIELARKAQANIPDTLCTYVEFARAEHGGWEVDFPVEFKRIVLAFLQGVEQPATQVVP